MKSISVKERMVPLSEYATVDEDADLHEAVLTLEETQKKRIGETCPDSALLVVNGSGSVVGRVSQWDVIRALEPKYEQMGNLTSISRAGFSPAFLKSMLQQYSLWDKPLANLCGKAPRLKVKDFMHAPSEAEIVEESATLDEAIHGLVMGRRHSLLVTRGKEIVGVLLLRDIFKEICENIKACER